MPLHHTARCVHGAWKARTLAVRPLTWVIWHRGSGEFGAGTVFAVSDDGACL